MSRVYVPNFDGSALLFADQYKIHVGKKDHRCPLCDSCFARRDTLRR